MWWGRGEGGRKIGYEPGLVFERKAYQFVSRSGGGGGGGSPKILDVKSKGHREPSQKQKV